MPYYLQCYLGLMFYGMPVMAQEIVLDTIPFYTMLEVQLEEQYCNAFIHYTKEQIIVDLACSERIEYFYFQQLYSSALAKLQDERLIRIKPGIYTLLPLENGHYRILKPELQGLDSLQINQMKQ